MPDPPTQWRRLAPGLKPSRKEQVCSSVIPDCNQLGRLRLTIPHSHGIFSITTAAEQSLVTTLLPLLARAILACGPGQALVQARILGLTRCLLLGLIGRTQIDDLDAAVLGS